MSKTTVAHAPTPTDDQIDRILEATADAFVHQLRGGPLPRSAIQLAWVLGNFKIERI
jgi:hypothetical protein